MPDPEHKNARLGVFYRRDQSMSRSGRHCEERSDEAIQESSGAGI
jgi:hypothetical protein